ncbi:MAG: AAC(3) family N-acetyltransferase, partial [Candidatus Zixiibacteriota bacterium]
MELISKIIHKGRLWAKRLLPDFIIDAVRFPSKYIRSRKRSVNRRTSTPLHLRDLIDDLKKAGITSGDIIMVHSSLSKIGNVVGGADTVIRSFTNLITTEGTLIMPCYNSAMQFVKDMKQGK